MALKSNQAFSKIKCGANLKFLTFILSFASWVALSNAGRFLIVLGPDKGSMMFTTIAIGDALIQRGHSVTILVDEIIVDHVRTHNPKFDLEVYKSTVKTEDVIAVEEKTTERALAGEGFWTGMYWASEMMDGLFYRQCRDLLKQDDVVNRIRQSNFDLALASLGHICPMLVAKHIDVPFVGLMQSFMPVQFAHALHQPINSAYMPPAFTGLSDRMSFNQRLLATLMSITQWPGFMKESHALPNFSELIDDIFPGKSIFRLVGDAELTFTTSHVALDFPHPVLPNNIIVGGLTTKPSKPLEKVNSKISLKTNKQANKNNNKLLHSNIWLLNVVVVRLVSGIHMCY